MSAADCLENGIFMIGLLPSVLCLFIILWISVQSIIQLNHRKDIAIALKILYYISCILGTTTIILCAIDSYLLCLSSSIKIMAVTAIIRRSSYLVLIGCVLGTLLFRISRTFKDSVLDITKVQKYGFIILYSITNISGICWLSTNRGQFASDRSENDQLLWSILIFINIILYSTTSIYGMLVFAQKMYKLSGAPFEIDTMQENFEELKKEQSALFHTASKYLSLLSLAIFTTWITFLMNFSYIHLFDKDWPMIAQQMTRMQYSLDCTINIICLYLQYPFCGKYYDKYCGCFGNFWLSIFERKAKNAFNKRLSHIPQHSNTNKTAETELN